MAQPLVVSAPGSLMLLGEHAVLHGYPCLVAAINRRVRIVIEPRTDGVVHIESALGSLTGKRQHLPEEPAFRFVIGALRHIPNSLTQGFDGEIIADMPATIGFGTSAAVTVAMIGALAAAAGMPVRPDQIMRESRTVIRKVQGRGSGADVAASAFGGVVHYRATDRGATVISANRHPITALYCGYKMPTPEVIAKVEKDWDDRPVELLRLYEEMAALSEMARNRIADPAAFGRILNEGQTCMETLGVSTPELAECVSILRLAPGITGAKISGSGMGDCAIGWGRENAGEHLPGRYESYKLETEPAGISIEQAIHR